MNAKPIRGLVVADDPDNVQLLEEAFREIEESYYSRQWMQPCERTYAVDLAEATDLLRTHPFDLVLLDLKLSNETALPAYWKLRAESRSTPVVVLASDADEGAALSLVRHGAQDYLVHSELDCVPLARLLRRTLERQRLLAARESVSLVDELTSSYNGRGLIHLGERHWKMAERFGLYIAAVQLQLSENDPQELDISAISLADRLRAVFDGTDLLAYLGAGRFAGVTVQENAAEADAKVRRLLETLGERTNVRLGWTGVRPSDSGTIEDLLAEAGQLLCENRHVANSAGCHL